MEPYGKKGCRGESHRGKAAIERIISLRIPEKEKRCEYRKGAFPKGYVNAPCVKSTTMALGERLGKKGELGVRGEKKTNLGVIQKIPYRQEWRRNLL